MGSGNDLASSGDAVEAFRASSLADGHDSCDGGGGIDNVTGSFRDEGFFGNAGNDRLRGYDTFMFRGPGDLTPTSGPQRT